MGWKGESRRHSLSRKGIKTNLPNGRRFDVSNYVARGNQTPEEREEYIRREIRDFQQDFCPYGYLDIKQAILHLDDYGKNSTDLQDMLDQYVEDTGVDRKDVDITAIAYEGILQEIRNEIDSQIGFDINNDASFYVAGNYMATSYDHSSGDQESLIEAIKDADVDSRNALLDDDNVVTWLGEVDIDVKQFKNLKASGRSKVSMVIKMMRKEKIESDSASPNFVKDFADNRGMSLSSEEVVKISNNYEKVGK